jgi:hypothetical protein
LAQCLAKFVVGDGGERVELEENATMVNHICVVYGARFVLIMRRAWLDLGIQKNRH